MTDAGRITKVTKTASRAPWWSRLLCGLGSHDWRNMDGICAECGWEDPLWR